MDNSQLEVPGSKLWMINFYRERLSYYDKVGLGNLTEFNVRVTPQLIAVTKKRLDQLTLVYDSKMTPQALRLRRLKVIRLKEKGQLNGHHINGNGTTATQSSENNSNTRHERDKS